MAAEISNNPLKSIEMHPKYSKSATHCMLGEVWEGGWLLGRCEWESHILRDGGARKPPPPPIPQHLTTHARASAGYPPSRP